MEYLLVMSLSGSTMMGIYLLLKRLLREEVSTRLYYLIAKVAVLFYLIPLPFLKGWYKEVIRAVLPQERPESVKIPAAWTIRIVHAGQKVYINDYASADQRGGGGRGGCGPWHVGRSALGGARVGAM